MYHFIINPKSRTGKGLKVWNIVQRELESREIAYTYHFTHFEFHATKIAKNLCREYPGKKVLVIVGGDGTVNEVIDGIDEKDYPEILLGYIPSGSSNDHARSLGISTNPKEALEHILSQELIVHLYHGIVKTPDRTRKYAGSAGIGYDAIVCRHALESPVKKFMNRLHLGKLTYLFIALKSLVEWEWGDLHVSFDGEKEVLYEQVLLLSPMNQPYEGGGMKMAPHADVGSMGLTVCVIHAMPKWKIFYLLPIIFAGKHLMLKGVEEISCKTVKVRPSRPMPVHTDGEYMGTFPEAEFTSTKETIGMIV